MAIPKSRRRTLAHVTIYAVILAGTSVMVFPLLWTLSTSLKTVDQLTALRLQLVPSPIAWSNYIELFGWVDIPLFFRNTMFMVLATEFGGLIVCSLVAYSFAKIPFPGRDFMFIVLLSTMMLPRVSTLIPYFLMFDRLGMINTFWPLIIPRLLAHNAFYIFLLRQFLMGIPNDLSDAARIDGCSEISIWWRIMMPNSFPVLATIAIFAFQYAWNDFLHPLIYLGAKRDNWTLALGLAGLEGAEAGAPPRTHLVMAYSILIIIPPIIVFAVGQRNIIKGVTFSGLKG